VNRVITVVTGRAGSSFRGKNTIPILGVPCAAYGIRAAQAINTTSEIYCSSDDPELLNLASNFNVVPIRRPGYLAGPTALHRDVLRHFLSQLPQNSVGSADYLLVILANAPVITAGWINRAIQLMDEDPLATSVIPVIVDNDKHPYRSRFISEEGYLQPYATTRPVISSNRQDLPLAAFPAHNFWLLRLINGFLPEHGSPPWEYFGDSPIPLVLPVDKCDIHGPGDIVQMEHELARITSLIQGPF